MQIGNVDIQGKVALGPMAGVTDLPFRLLCKEQDCGLIYTEMVSAKAILYNNKNTIDLLKSDESERPVALQLFGSEPDIMGEIAGRVSEGPYDFIDVNMGCPVPKIVNNGEGSALMKNPELDVVSIGVNPFAMHSPKERLGLAPIPPQLKLIVETMGRLAE